MRALSQNLRRMIQSGANFAFGFDIQCLNGRNFFFTNYCEVLTIGDAHYNPNSALNIVKANFNDSAHDIVEVSGIFEDSGLNIAEDLTGAKIIIKIILVSEKIAEQLLTLFCFNILKEQQKFTLYLKNHVAKLEQSATKIYSKTCRAKLGDALCRVNLENFSSVIHIDSIENNLIVVNIPQPAGYYNYGRMHFVGSNIFMLILRQNANSLILDRNVPEELLLSKEIKIFPGCDKTLETCYTRFCNVLNFRGEPFVPEFNYEKIL
jgi:uncharacterized phage protein (TIGR02218 family)